MPDTQTTQMLIMSLPSLSDTTVKLIHATVKPLNCKGVSDYLRQYKQRHKWTSSAIFEVNGVSASSGVGSKKSFGSKCTEQTCFGPHPSKDCWLEPENFNKRDKFLSRRRGNPSASLTNSCKEKYKGIKKISHPSANSASASDILSLHTSFKDVSASVNTVHTVNSDRALHNTGATHHVFNDSDMFNDASLKLLEWSSKRLKLAGANVLLNVKGTGAVRLKAGGGCVFKQTRELLRNATDSAPLG